MTNYPEDWRALPNAQAIRCLMSEYTFDMVTPARAQMWTTALDEVNDMWFAQHKSGLPSWGRTNDDDRLSKLRSLLRDVTNAANTYDMSGITGYGLRAGAYALATDDDSALLLDAPLDALRLMIAAGNESAYRLFPYVYTRSKR